MHLNLMFFGFEQDLHFTILIIVLQDSQVSSDFMPYFKPSLKTSYTLYQWCPTFLVCGPDPAHCASPVRGDAAMQEQPICIKLWLGRCHTTVRPLLNPAAQEQAQFLCAGPAWMGLSQTWEALKFGCRDTCEPIYGLSVGEIQPAGWGVEHPCFTGLVAQYHV